MPLRGLTKVGTPWKQDQAQATYTAEAGLGLEDEDPTAVSDILKPGKLNAPWDPGLFRTLREV